MLKNIFYLFSVTGFFFPYVLKFLISSTNDSLKIFAIYSMQKFNLIYFAVVIIFFFMGLTNRFKFARYAQILFVGGYLTYVFADYFIISKTEVENYVKTHKNTVMVKMTDLKKIKNFKIKYKKANYCAVEILKEENKTLPFNYRKDRNR